MSYEVNTEALTFEDVEEHASKQSHCAICKMSESSSIAIKYLKDLEESLLLSNSQSVYETMSECWDRYICAPLNARGENCPCLSATQMRTHFERHTFSSTRLMLQDLRRVSQLQSKMPVFASEDVNGKIVTDKIAAKHYAALGALKMDLLKQLRNVPHVPVPDPPDMNVLMED